MLCRKPYMVGRLPVGCGQCLHCRINRRRLWTTRIVLESYCHEANCFATFTYRDDAVPSGGNLDPRHLQLFWKRLRRAIEPRKIRFFAVGEYGDRSERPHYHAAVFGLSEFEVYRLEASWPHGFVMAAELNTETAQYIAGYTVKKLTQKDDPRLRGRRPEFARMSNRPGIGAGAAAVIAASLRDAVGVGDDVPSTVRIGGKPRAVGRYLLAKVREEYGLTPEQIEKIKERYVREKTDEVQALLGEEIRRGGLGAPSRTLAAEDAGRAASIEARQKILNSKRRL